jgi:hypothetical protein
MRKVSKTPRLVCILMVLAITLACNMPLISNTGNSATSTATLEAADTSTSTPPPSSPTSSPTIPTVTETPTFTSTVTAAPLTPTNTTAPVACNKASFVSDVNYPDGTDIIAGATITKTWRLQNTGTCDWTSGYKLIFYSGDRMGAPDETVLTSGIIPSGAVADVSVTLTAPTALGSYKGYFKLKSPDNVVFGINASGNDAFWVEINSVQIKIFKPIMPLLPQPTNTPTWAIKYIPLPKPTLHLQFP